MKSLDEMVREIKLNKCHCCKIVHKSFLSLFFFSILKSLLVQRLKKKQNKQKKQPRVRCDQDAKFWDETDYMRQAELNGVQHFLRQDSLKKGTLLISYKP